MPWPHSSRERPPPSERSADIPLLDLPLGDSRRRRRFASATWGLVVTNVASVLPLRAAALGARAEGVIEALAISPAQVTSLTRMPLALPSGYPTCSSSTLGRPPARDIAFLRHLQWTTSRSGSEQAAVPTTLHHVSGWSRPPPRSPRHHAPQSRSSAPQKRAIAGFLGSSLVLFPPLGWKACCRSDACSCRCGRAPPLPARMVPAPAPGRLARAARLGRRRRRLLRPPRRLRRRAGAVLLLLPRRGRRRC